MTKRKLATIGLLLLAPVAAGAFLIQSKEPLDGARLFAQVLQRIEDSAVDSVSRNALYEKGERLFISWDGWRRGQPRGWETCALTVLEIPASERP